MLRTECTLATSNQFGCVGAEQDNQISNQTFSSNDFFLKLNTESYQRLRMSLAMPTIIFCLSCTLEYICASLEYVP